MKKSLLLLWMIGCVALQAQVSAPHSQAVNSAARRVSAGDVPNLIVANFNIKIANVVPEWTDDGDNYMAAYADSVNLSHIFTYDKNGNLIVTQDELSATTYPAAIQRYHDRHYRGEKFTVWLNTDANGNKTYYFTRNKETVWFDPKGNPIEKSRNKKVH